jgi:hypothetical protein
VAIDPQAPPKPGLSERVAVIENELPAYRAIEPVAVLSVLFGALAALSFANLWFLIAAGLALALGAWAEWKIRTFPDVYTGRGLAQAGIALAIIFSLSSVTISYVQEFILKRDATAFGKKYVAELKKGDLATAFWYRLPPEARRASPPEEVLKKMMEGARDPMSAEQHIGPTKALLERIKQPGGDVHFDRIEATGYDELTRVALVLLEVHGPAEKDRPAQEFAMVEVKSDPAAGKVPGWFVSEVLYPYKRNSRVVTTTKKADDGHGH